jgi:hypothetical protein
MIAIQYADMNQAPNFNFQTHDVKCLGVPDFALLGNAVYMFHCAPVFKIPKIGYTYVYASVTRIGIDHWAMGTPEFRIELKSAGYLPLSVRHESVVPGFVNLSIAPVPAASGAADSVYLLWGDYYTHRIVHSIESKDIKCQGEDAALMTPLGRTRMPDESVTARGCGVRSVQLFDDRSNSNDPMTFAVYVLPNEAARPRQLFAVPLDDRKVWFGFPFRVRFTASFYVFRFLVCFRFRVYFGFRFRVRFTVSCSCSFSVFRFGFRVGFRFR